MAIRYKIKSAEDHQLVLVHNTSLFFLTLIFGLIGGGMLAVGLITIWGRDYGEAVPIVGVILTSMGWVFAAAALLMYTLRNANPHRIVFDNTKGQVLISQRKARQEHSVGIPYNDIAGFSIRKEVKSGSTSSSRTGSRTYYQVFWQKKDSSIWDVERFTSLKKATAFQEQLEAHLSRADQHLAATGTYKLPDVLTKEVRQDGTTAFRWKNTLSIPLVLFGVILMGFWGIDYVLYLQGDALPFGIMTAILGLISLVLVFYIFKNFTTEYAIEITSSELLYLENEQKKKSIQLSDIAAVNFDLKKSMGGSPIRILTHAQLEQVRQQGGSVALSDVINLIKSAMQIFQLQVEGLDVVDKVNLEHYLQEELEKAGASRVL